MFFQLCLGYGSRTLRQQPKVSILFCYILAEPMPKFELLLLTIKTAKWGAKTATLCLVKTPFASQFLDNLSKTRIMREVDT